MEIERQDESGFHCDVTQKAVIEAAIDLDAIRSPTHLAEESAEWVSSLPVWAQITLVEHTVHLELNRLKQTLIALSDSSKQTEYDQKQQGYNDQLLQLAAAHKQKKQQRDRQRAKVRSQPNSAEILKSLQKESQQDKRERKRLKQKRDSALQPLREAMIQSQRQIKTLKQQYKTLSKAWQEQMQATYECDQTSTSLHLLPAIQDIVDRAQVPLHQQEVAKRLHHAIAKNVTPIEFTTEQQTLAEHCALLPAVLRTSASKSLSVLYQDPHLIVIEKPTGLLSVPGRSYHKQDSVISRLRRQLSYPAFLQLPHRLDQSTSGLLIAALSSAAHTALSQQFAQKKIHKQYQAILTRPIAAQTGSIVLPIKADPHHRPLQIVSVQTGKPSQTSFQRLTADTQPRVNFTPHTGRTHQLRVHAAHPLGLNAPILGDSLYGAENTTIRLHLHAIALQFTHPITHEVICLHSPAPF